LVALNMQFYLALVKFTKSFLFNFGVWILRNGLI
jgi:hypothetical protein